MADACLMVRVVGAPERAELAEQVGAFVGHLGRAKPIDRIAAGLAADGEELVADLIDGGVPRGAGPLAIDELHRVPQAAIAMHELAHRGALGTMGATIDRAIP